MAAMLTLNEVTVTGRESKPGQRDGAQITKWYVEVQGQPDEPGGIPPKMRCLVKTETFGPCPEAGDVISGELNVFPYKGNDGGANVSFSLVRRLPIPGLRAAS